MVQHRSLRVLSTAPSSSRSRSALCLNPGANIRERSAGCGAKYHTYSTRPSLSLSLSRCFDFPQTVCRTQRLAAGPGCSRGILISFQDLGGFPPVFNLFRASFLAQSLVGPSLGCAERVVLSGWAMLMMDSIFHKFTVRIL